MEPFPIFGESYYPMKHILFVCLGNICRSPAAEGIFRKMAKTRGLPTGTIDSAGTGNWKVGEPDDPRMKEHARARGYHLNHVARQFNAALDFDRFDLILAMDDQNFSDLKKAARNHHDRAKIRKITRYSKRFGYTFVPDPYPGGEEGFELVLDLLEDACEGLLEQW